MRKLVVTAVVLVLLGVLAVNLWHHLTGKLQTLLPQADECTAVVDGHAVSLSTDQSANAALISAIAVERGLPAHAATIALATAMQESKLVNLSGGDRDSVGLFQQRTSQGWGSKKQIMNPVYATNRFYDALVKVPNYVGLPVTVAAQDVQHSAYPSAYAPHEADARALASALTGFSPHTFGCQYSDPTAGHGRPVQLGRRIARFFPGTPVVRGHEVAVDAPDPTTGWAIAQFAAAYGQEYGVERITYRGYRWSNGDDRWHRDGAATSATVSVTLA